MNTITVDRTQKEDVVYIRDNELSITKDKKNTLKIEDMYKFIFSTIQTSTGRDRTRI